MKYSFSLLFLKTKDKFISCVSKILFFAPISNQFITEVILNCDFLFFVILHFRSINVFCNMWKHFLKSYESFISFLLKNNQNIKYCFESPKNSLKHSILQVKYIKNASKWKQKKNWRNVPWCNNYYNNDPWLTIIFYNTTVSLIVHVNKFNYF